MPRIYLTTRQGDEKLIEGTSGQSLMEVIRDNGVDELVALCGGYCSCATCHVYIAEQDASRLPPTSDIEHEMLASSLHRKATSRLSCQIKVGDDLDCVRIFIAPED